MPALRPRDTIKATASRRIGSHQKTQASKAQRVGNNDCTCHSAHSGDRASTGLQEHYQPRLILAALAEGTSQLSGVLDSQDTQVMIASLRRLGIGITHDPVGGTARIVGCGGRPPANSAELWLENSGTSMRFLTAVACLGRGTYRLDGNSRMANGRSANFATALNNLGSKAMSQQGNGCPPIVVTAAQLPGGTAHVAANISSQFLSALLMAALVVRSTLCSWSCGGKSSPSRTST